MHNWLVGYELISQLPKIVGSEEPNPCEKGYFQTLKEGNI